MPIVKMITVIGNSSGVILDRPILQRLGWDVDTWVTIAADGERVIVRRATEEEARQAAEGAPGLGKRAET